MQTSSNNDLGRSPGQLVTIAVLATSSLTIMANATISASLPGLLEHFSDVPNIETLLGFMVSLPSLSIVLSAALFGILAERFGRKPVLLTAFSLYAMGGASGLYLDSIVGLLIGRVVLGLGVAGIMTVATMLAADLWSGQARIKFMGKQAAFTSLGGVIFIALGGLLAELSWRGAFSIYLLAIPIAVFAVLHLEIKQKATESLLKQKVPLDWGVCLKICVLAFLSMSVFYLIPTRLPFVITGIGVTSASISGLVLAAGTLAGVVASVNFQRVRKFLSPLAIFALGFSCYAVGYGIIAIGTSLTQIIIGSMIAGLGVGFIMPNQNNWLMGAIPPEASGRAAGILTTFVFAGQFAAPLFAGIANQYVSQQGIFAVFAIASGLLAAILVVLVNREVHQTGAELKC